MKPHVLMLMSSLSLVGPQVGSLAAAQEPWRVGEPLPHVHLSTLDGEREVDLASFLGTKLLLIEFASW